MAQLPSNLRQMSSLVEIVAQLRGPQGCPWDKEQTHESLTQYAIEETHELVEAIEAPESPLKAQKMKEELGDVLFQVVLHAQLAAERGSFTFDDVVQTLAEKMIRRHPHVFGEEKVNGKEDVLHNWEIIKKQEKAAAAENSAIASTTTPSYTLEVPPLPALQRAYKIGKRTEKLKFDWENAEGVLLKVEEEYDELREALEEENIEHIEHELGDVLFSLAQLSRHLELEPERTLRRANQRFELRFNTMVAIAAEEGHDWGNLNLDEKEAYWLKAKSRLKSRHETRS
ncbi:MAG: nucleoside triphosphate pyrophosphohydrolase [Bdellovibrio sp.]